MKRLAFPVGAIALIVSASPNCMDGASEAARTRDVMPVNAAAELHYPKYASGDHSTDQENSKKVAHTSPVQRCLEHQQPNDDRARGIRRCLPTPIISGPTPRRGHTEPAEKRQLATTVRLPLVNPA